PTIFRIALDYLPTQATSVPSWRVFSAGHARSTLSPDVIEALQMLKYLVRRGSLSFTD
ncbi:uncharacterized protein B0H18DRAFT_861217, partial [Fomitopsis serialis]|uniref:uncharacterized protein n=1 Tax=Fomitopsis serialis TaxID=139415 RepID=UPI0020073463